MPGGSPTPITLPDEGRTRALASLRQFFAEDLDFPIGELKATIVLDYILTEHAPAIYNQAVADARQAIEQRLADLPDVLYHDEYPRWRRTSRGRG